MKLAGKARLEGRQASKAGSKVAGVELVPGTPCRTLVVPPLSQVQNLRPFYSRVLEPGLRSGSCLLIG